MWLPEDEAFCHWESKLPTNHEEMVEFHDLLQSQRNDLLGVEPYIFFDPPQLDILHLWTYTTRHVQVHDKGYREALDPLLFEAFTKEVTMGPELKLTLPLHTGEDKWGQVWKGEIRYNGKEADVAVKLYFQSLFPLPDSFEEIQVEGWAASPLQARKEAWAYAHMHSLQGREIPRSLGFFQCALSTGEIAFAHVMEFIRGGKAEKTFLKDCSPDMKMNIAESMASGIVNIGACGIIHEDFHGGYILIGDDFLPPVCYIDFSMAEPLVQELSPSYMIGVVKVLRKMGIEMDLVKKWIEKRKKDNPEWMKLVRELEKQPGLFDWLVVIESSYDANLYKICSKKLEENDSLLMRTGVNAP